MLSNRTTFRATTFPRVSPPVSRYPIVCNVHTRLRSHRIAPHRTALTLRHTCRESLDNKEIGWRANDERTEAGPGDSGWNFKRVF